MTDVIRAGKATILELDANGEIGREADLFCVAEKPILRLRNSLHLLFSLFAVIGWQGLKLSPLVSELSALPVAQARWRTDHKS